MFSKKCLVIVFRITIFLIYDHLTYYPKLSFSNFIYILRMKFSH